LLAKNILDIISCQLMTGSQLLTGSQLVLTGSQLMLTRSQLMVDLNCMDLTF
jgi:hypothetical protein